MDCSVAAVTVSSEVPEMAPDVAEIVEEPTPCPVAKPPAVMVATAGVAEFHVTLEVRFWVLPSLKVPVAANCCDAPLAIVGFTGATAIDCRVAAVTVSRVLPLTDPEVAVIVEVPTPAPDAKPEALMVATDVVAEVQVTLPVKFCVLLSLNVPVAVNC